MIKSIAPILAIFLWTLPLLAQETTVYTEAYESYKKGIELFEKGVFAKAQVEFQKTIDLLRPINEEKSNLLLAKSELFYAKCAVRLEHPDGEKLILNFIRKYSPSPLATQARIEIADYYFQAKDWEKAIEFYSKVDPATLGKEKRTEWRFNWGYALFVKQSFKQAKDKFRYISTQTDSKYFYPSNYYLGLCYFFEGEFDSSIKVLRVAEKSKKYQSHIPYYIAQIYFAQRRFDDLIAYATPRLSVPGTRKEKELNQLVGQAHFEKQRYKDALPYLEYYADRTGRLREEEFYQLGLCQYFVKKYKDAARNLSELSDTDTKVGQHAMYILGFSHLNLGDKKSAQAAFARAQRLNYDPILTEESLFNYAKLSYELKSDREALNALQSIPSSSRYYEQAQALMGDIFLNSRDYEQALKIIEKIPNKTIEIQESYQKVAFYRGLQLLRKNQVGEAKTMFNKSLSFPNNQSIKAQTLYWMADIDYREKNHDQSLNKLAQFITLARTLNDLPGEASLFSASYLQGYNYLKKENYANAYRYFMEAIDGIRRNRTFIGNKQVKDQLLGDATVRAADCQFKRNRYNDARKFYNEAIQKKYPGYEYAIYQLAIIEGLRGRITDKLLALERIPREFPKSEFADDALLQLGTTYQEIGQLEKAIPPLQRLVNEYQGRSNLINQALLKLGLISYNQNNLPSAINYYKRIFNNNPDPDEASVALAALEEIYVDDLNQPDQFFAFLETVPGYKVDNREKDSINFRAAESAFENGNYDRAIQGFSDYIRKFPTGINVLEAYYLRGESYTVLKRYGDAIRDYEYVVNKGQSSYYVKALEKAAVIAYNYSEDFNKAFDLYQRLEEAALSPEMRFEAQLGALRSAYRTNNTQAVYELAQRVANNPSATTEHRATSNFYLGKIAFDRQDYSNALAAFDKVINLSDNEQTAEARYLRARIYYMQRDLQTAYDICYNANRESSAYPYWVAKCIILLSDILAEQGDLYNARAALEALLENYNEDPEIVNTARDKLNQLNKQIERTNRIETPTQSNFLEFDNDGN